jgi:hypothetical protein
MRHSVFVLLSCLLLFAPRGGSATARVNGSPRQSAVEKSVFVVVDTGWSAATQASDCVTGQADDSWQLELSSAANLTVEADDEACPGDFFEIYVDGIKVGTTPRPDAWGCSASGTLSSGSFSVDLCTGTHSITFRDAGFDGHSQAEIAAEHMCPAGFRVAGTLAALKAAPASCSALTITQPADQHAVALDQQDLTATAPVSFTATGPPGPPIQWTAQLTYMTAGGVGATATTPYQLSRTFQTGSGAAHQETYAAMGGQVTVNASSGTLTAQPITFFVTGSRISGTEITTRLLALYSGATRRLMTGIAQKESSYRQFGREVLFGVAALWPLESYPTPSSPKGAHIGLMMVPAVGGIGNAWSWLVNTQAGVTLFGDKLATAHRKMVQIQNRHAGLRDLNPVELENMALVLYGDHPSASLNKQYYLAVRTSGGGWDWLRNTTGNPLGVAYADAVRKLMK